LPFLDVKTEYIWGGYQIDNVTNRDVDVISIDRENTVETLRDQLQNLLVSGHDDAGFPILTSAVDEEGTRLVGYIGASELEHALSVVADVADGQVFFHTTFGHTDMTSSSASSFMDHPITDPFDFSVYMDQAPLTIQSNSPLELVHQFFVKLGARIIVVTDPNGEYEGIIDKKTWLAFLSGLEERS
jgi:chloride channel 3/4/5